MYSDVFRMYPRARVGKPSTIPFEVPAIPKRFLEKARKTLPALERVPVAEPDSSDEEEERLLALGQQGQ